ncbi:type I-E CRISPR-associated protein Cas6/Cse3/CasE [Prodigiosinella confusarubida]|uniref:Type I-E CRISPR-associated protein Cas6/Cse3/CasE n=1 Tax=Serratia sp. (strain ATCC 39006) TaxID=104623 RepID=A0A2I5T3Y7_SERS3|nr:type I-E CRISPR-associated protein Cas6/Cse3/CasE [Serratia sp. ATCC 39006]AUG99241.1 type I-E CRISPR-associated protein Cas6/Cse3/CasE [Serratia sp. ATCC 39006]AUH03557.1 type I-E CRISPR-associated protein Cas6/Cse3/CasE [Serratia sp. ATCC 39006]
MFFSRVTLQLAALPAVMAQKRQYAGGYASHQWLWQLFPQDETRHFLFREETLGSGNQFYLLSQQAPRQDHNLFRVETKPYQPQLRDEMALQFSLRANPVVMRQRQRSDVLMDAKQRARQQGVSGDALWRHQQDAATQWLQQQGEQRGFTVAACRVDGYQRHRLYKPGQENAIQFSSVDFDGLLRITDVSRFMTAVQQGLGKSKALGCGLLLLRRA